MHTIYQTKRLSSGCLSEAAALLKEGELVAFPTETVYGLGAPLFSRNGIEKIFQVKQRARDNPLIVHISDFHQVETVAVDLPLAFFLLADRFFPGPLTLVVKRHPRVPQEVSAGLSSLAVRMPAHPVARKLISLVGAPLVAPSANLSGKPSATSARDVLEDFEGKIAAVIDAGAAENGIESTVLSLLEEKPVLLRPGVIAKEVLEEVLKMEIASFSGGQIVSPGMKYRHYAPLAQIQVFFDEEELVQKGGEFDPQTMILLSRKKQLFASSLPLHPSRFYAELRQADRENKEAIWILCDQEIQKEEGFLNRILCSAGILHI